MADMIDVILAMALSDGGGGGGGGGGTPVPVSGTTVDIEAQAGKRYVCTESYVTEVTFVPAEEGECSIVFTSGTTPTVLSFGTATVTMPDWWNGVEANRIYEISIADGLAVVTSWAT